MHKGVGVCVHTGSPGHLEYVVMRDECSALGQDCSGWTQGGRPRQTSQRVGEG